MKLIHAALTVTLIYTIVPSAGAEDTAYSFILPPPYNYGAVCKADKAPDTEAMEKLRRQSLAELSPPALLQLAEAYSGKNDAIAPDYPFVLEVTEQLLKLPYRGDNRQLIDNAIFIRQEILYKGKAGAAQPAEARALLDKLISRNHANAWRRYGEIDENEQRYEQAAESYKKAIIAGNITAYFNLARLYLDHKVNVPPAEFRRVLSSLQDAALQSIAKGNCNVMREMAKLYERLMPAEGAKEHSLAWYSKAAETPDSAAKLDYADLLTQQQAEKHRERIVTLWEEAAALGSVRAMRRLGEYYLAPRTFDPVKAEKWLSQAGARQDAKISTLMQWAESLNYQQPPPYSRIAAIYNRAAAQGHADAFYRLGRLYQNDIRSEGHMAQAMDYYKKAVGAGHIPAMRALQTVYSCNIGVGFNADKAEYWQQQAETAAAAQAEETDHFSELIRLGDQYAERRSYPQAIHYYQQAAEEKNSAYRKLYYLYRETGDLEQAMQSLQRLASHDDAEAMFRLAMHYDNLKDTAKAQYWFQQAVSHYPCGADLVQEIADSYLQGKNGAPREIEKAEYWQGYLSRMPLRGHIDPIPLARLRLYKQNSQSDTLKKEAKEILTEMAEEGNEAAGHTLIDYYLLQSSGKDLLALLTELAEEGSVSSMLYLSNLYVTGFGGIQPDKEKAIYWLRQAKNEGSETASQRFTFLTQ